MPQILRSILHDMYNVPSSGYRGTNGIIERIEQQFYWPNIAKPVHNYIGACDSCQGIKAQTRKKQG